MEPLGLQQLMMTDQVVVNNEFHCGFGLKYKIYTPQGVILTIKGVVRQKAKDNNKQEVMVMLRKAFTLLATTEVFVWRFPRLLIRLKGGVSRSVYIDDENKQHILKLKPTTPPLTLGHVQYSIISVRGETEIQQVGVLRRNWTKYSINFPPDLEVRYKGALIAACAFLDQLRQQNNI